jgi:hypothetical protein
MRTTRGKDAIPSSCCCNSSGFAYPVSIVLLYTLPPSLVVALLRGYGIFFTSAAIKKTE